MPFPIDSPLSITASIAGILTFVFAIGASIYIRYTYLANADHEYFRVKASLSWYKTESAWLEDLVRATARSPVQTGVNGVGNGLNGIENESSHSPATSAQLQHQIYIFTTDQLHQLESRLLELLTEAEMRAVGHSGEMSRWTLVGGGTGIAVAWLRVRARALDLVRQRDALGGRVLFVQMSAVERRVGECKREIGLLRKEMTGREGEVEERLERVEELVKGLGKERIAQMEHLSREFPVRNGLKIRADEGRASSETSQSDESQNISENRWHGIPIS